MSRAIGNLTARSRQGKIHADNPHLASKLLADDKTTDSKDTKENKPSKTLNKPSPLGDSQGGKTPRKSDSNLGGGEVKEAGSTEPPNTGRDSRFTAGDSGRKSVKQVAFSLDLDAQGDAGTHSVGGGSSRQRLHDHKGPRFDPDPQQSGRSETVGRMSNGAAAADSGGTEQEAGRGHISPPHNNNNNVGEGGHHIPGASVTWDSEDFPSDAHAPNDDSPQEENTDQWDKDTVTSSTAELGRLRSPSHKSLNAGEGETPPPSTRVAETIESTKREEVEERPSEKDKEGETNAALSERDEDQGEPTARLNSTEDEREKDQTPSNEEIQVKDSLEEPTPTPTNQPPTTNPNPNPTFSQASPRAPRSRSTLSKPTLTPRDSVTSSGVNPDLLKTSVEDKSLKLESSDHPRFTTPYSSQRLKPRGETAKRSQVSSSAEIDKNTNAATDNKTSSDQPADSLEDPQTTNPQAFSIDSLDLKDTVPDIGGEQSEASTKNKPGEDGQQTAPQAEDIRTDPSTSQEEDQPSPSSDIEVVPVGDYEKNLPAPPGLADEPRAQSPKSIDQNEAPEEDRVEFVIKPDPNKPAGASRYSSAQGSGRFSSRTTPVNRRASQGSSADPESRRRSSGTDAGKRVLYVESPTFTRDEEEEYRYVSSRLEDVEEEDPKLGVTPRDGYALRRGKYTYSQPAVAMAATHKQQRPGGVAGGDQPAVTVALEKRVRYSDVDTVVNPPDRYEDKDLKETDRDVDRMIGAAFPVDARQGAYSQAGKHELMMEVEFPISRFSVDTRGRRPGLPEEARVPPQPRNASLGDSQGSQALRNVMDRRDDGQGSQALRKGVGGIDDGHYEDDRRPRDHHGNPQYPPGERYPQGRGGMDNVIPIAPSHGPNVNSELRGHNSGYSQGPAGFEPQPSQPMPRGVPHHQGIAPPNTYSQQQQHYQQPPPNKQQQQRQPAPTDAQRYQQRDGYSQLAQDPHYQQQRIQPQPPPLQQQHQYQQPPQRQQEEQQLQPPPQPPRVKSLELPTGPSYDPADEADLERETTYQQSLRTRIEEVKRQTEETQIPRLPLAGDPPGMPGEGYAHGHPGQGYPQGQGFAQGHPSQGYTQGQGRPRFVPGSQDFAPDSLDFYEERDDGGDTLRALEEAFGGGVGVSNPAAQRQPQRATNHFQSSNGQFGAPAMDSDRDPYSTSAGQFGGDFPQQQRQPQSRLDNVNFDSEDFGDEEYEDFRHPRRNPQVQPRFFNPELAAAVAQNSSSDNNNYSNNAGGVGGGGGRQQQQQQHHHYHHNQQQLNTDRSDFDGYNGRFRDENVNESGNMYGGGNGDDGRGGGGGRGQHNPDEDEEMEASHPKPPKYDYVSHNKEDYGKAPPKSYKQISVIQKEEKEKLNGVFIQPKPKGGGILKKRRGRGGGGPGTRDTSRQGSLYSGDGSYFEDDQLPEGEAEEGMSAAEQVWARRSNQLAGSQQRGGRGRRGGGRGGHVAPAPGGLQKHHSDSSINQIPYGSKRDSNNDRQQHHHHQQHAPLQHPQYQNSPQQQHSQQQQRQTGSDKRAFMTDLPTPVNEQLSNQVAIPFSPRQGEIHLQPIHQQIVTEDGQRISVDVNLRLVSPPPQQQASPNHHLHHNQSSQPQQQQHQQQQHFRSRQYPAVPQYNEEDLLDDHGGGYSDYTAADPIIAANDYRYISPRERYSADEVLRALSESRTDLNPYGKVPPIDGGRGRGYRDDDHPSSAPVIDQGGSYMDVYMRQRDKEADKPWYKVYGLKDYRKMVKEVRLGTLGPDLDSDATRDRREKSQRQQDYAKVVMERNRTELVNKKPPAFPRPKENNDIMNRRRVAQEYAKSVPKPTVRVRPNEYNNYEIASEKSPIAKHHRKVTSTSSSPSVGLASATPGESRAGQSTQQASRPGGKEKEMEVLNLERLRQRYEQDKQNEAAIRQTSGRLY